MPVIFIGDLQDSWEDIPPETLTTWTEKDKERMKLKKAVKLSNILQAENRLRELLSCKQMLKKER